MSAEGRLARGKANFEAGIFLDNPETLEYKSTLKTSEEKPKAKPKEKKDDKSDK